MPSAEKFRNQKMQEKQKINTLTFSSADKKEITFSSQQ